MRNLVLCTALTFVTTIFATAVSAAPVVYNDNAAFLAAAGTPTSYGFETHGLVEGDELAGSSPISAAQLDNHFDLAFTNFISFSLLDNPGSVFAVEGSHFIFSNSFAGAQNYTLTFSNFGGTNSNVMAFGLTVVDFASNINQVATITYQAGGLSGTLLSVMGPQPDFTQNFVGLIVDASEAFDTITLFLDDNLSGMQSFDEVLYAAAAQVPVPGSIVMVLSALGSIALMSRLRRA